MATRPENELDTRRRSLSRLTETYPDCRHVFFLRILPGFLSHALGIEKRVPDPDVPAFVLWFHVLEEPLERR